MKRRGKKAAKKESRIREKENVCVERNRGVFFSYTVFCEIKKSENKSVCEKSRPKKEKEGKKSR